MQVLGRALLGRLAAEAFPPAWQQLAVSVKLCKVLTKHCFKVRVREGIQECEMGPLYGEEWSLG